MSEFVEKRIRVEFFIPTGLFEFRYHRVVEFLRRQLARTHGGSTRTAVFQGLYLNPQTGKLDEDFLHVVFSDVKFDLSNPEQRIALIDYMTVLKGYVEDQLPGELEIWLTFYPIERAGVPYSE